MFALACPAAGATFAFACGDSLLWFSGMACCAACALALAAGAEGVGVGVAAPDLFFALMATVNGAVEREISQP